MAKYRGYRGKHCQPYNIYFFYAALALFVFSAAVFLFLPYARFLALFFCALGMFGLIYYLLGLVPSFASLGAVSFYLRRAMVVGFCLWLGSFLVVESLITAYSKDADESKDPDYAIVMGAGLHGSTPSLILRSRLDTALRFYHEHPDVILVVSGSQGSGEDISEAEAMRVYLTDHGVAEASILEEPKSDSSLENLRNSFALIDRNAENSKGSPEISIITSDFHTYRAGILADRENRIVDLVSAPTPQLYLRITYGIREYFALVKSLFVR